MACSFTLKSIKFLFVLGPPALIHRRGRRYSSCGTGKYFERRFGKFPGYPARRRDRLAIEGFIRPRKQWRTNWRAGDMPARKDPRSTSAARVRLLGFKYRFRRSAEIKQVSFPERCPSSRRWEAFPTCRRIRIREYLTQAYKYTNISKFHGIVYRIPGILVFRLTCSTLTRGFVYLVSPCI